jgi:hypothetical protein
LDEKCAARGLLHTVMGLSHSVRCSLTGAIVYVHNRDRRA